MAAATARSCLKLLLDQMWPPWIADRLRLDGHDVEGVVERADLVHGSDDVVFHAAQAEHRAIVTENVPDYRKLAQEALARGDRHYGLVFTSNRSWPRHRRETASDLVVALDDLLRRRRGEDDLLDQEWWPRRR